MKNFAVIIMIFVFFSACNGNSRNHDSDDLPDLHDYDNTDADLSDDLSDEALAESENKDDDADVYYQEAEDCPALMWAKFPYYRKDGTIHFCRKCDQPAKSDDPDCVKNLWSEINKKYYNKYPERDCLDYPCVIKGMKSEIEFGTDCDKLLTPRNDYLWDAGGRGLRHHFIDNDKAVFDMSTGISSFQELYSYSTDSRLFSYDATNDEYTIIIPTSYYNVAYFKGKFVAYVMNYNKISNEQSYSTAHKKQFMVMYEEGKGYKVVYPSEFEEISRPGFAFNEKWLALNFREKTYAPYKIIYADVNEWKWHEFEIDYPEYAPDISGNNLVFNDDKGNAYICDLSKFPDKVSDCKLINREGEYIYNPVMNKTDPTRIAYATRNEIDQEIIIKVVKIEGEKLNYSEHKLPYQPFGNIYKNSVDQFKDETIVHKIIVSKIDQNAITTVCYFDLNTQKNLCQKSTWPDGGIFDFDGKYLLCHTNVYVILRDMECYCKEYPDQCLYDEYMPETPVLKKK
ncbi:MAG TPA: hypothetical protein VLJ60_08290 [bacterium]|nr:hypothetical protein [bacterium]